MLSGSQKTTSPAKIFNIVNRDLKQYIKTQEFMSAFLAVFDSNNNFKYSNAGHPGALHFKADGKIDTLDTEGFVLGSIFDMKNSIEIEHIPVYQPDLSMDRLYHYTSYQKALNKILANNTLLFNAIRKSKDPMEKFDFKAIGFGFQNAPLEEKVKSIEKFETYLNQVIKENLRMCCFCADITEEQSKNYKISKFGWKKDKQTCLLCLRESMTN